MLFHSWMKTNLTMAIKELFGALQTVENNSKEYSTKSSYF